MDEMDGVDEVDDASIRRAAKADILLRSHDRRRLGLSTPSTWSTSSTPASPQLLRRAAIRVRGAVQGVGFRPYVYNLAVRLGLGGYVLNGPEGVAIEVEGSPDSVESFLKTLRENPPPLARIVAMDIRDVAASGERRFAVRESARQGARTVFVLPDVATCPDCLRELRDPHDRRYRYPFVNCTNCGPRYTIIQDLPYDRARTTMAKFPMCADCRAEYEDPSNRRFHAEPTCCPACGPRVELTDASGAPLPCADAIETAIERLGSGAIAAVKGLGGFHLVCDAANAEAVRTLRRRKERDLKPFAVMVRDLDAAAIVGEIHPHAAESLSGAERPIVLLPKKAGHGLAEEVAPRSASFGVMLPYTPLHHLLMAGPFRALVMTSGNVSHEPIAHTNEDAIDRLGALADIFLLNDRAIHIRTDDSVVRVIAGKPRFLRRSRGYAPYPVSLPTDTSACEILAVGPELNSTVCVTRRGQAFLSHHVGDLQNVPAYEGFRQAVTHLEQVLEVAPGAVACDLHPAYLSTKYARERKLPVVEVQHHHAHIASVLAEWGRTDRVIGVAFDGIGWGTDGRPWGGEFLVCDLADFERAGHFEPVPQPGGDVAAKRIAHMAYAYLRAAFGEDADAWAARLLPAISEGDRAILARMIERSVNCPPTSSVGRLFDAASALLGICDFNSFHAQAPMELEAAAAQAAEESAEYPARIDQNRDGAYVAKGSDIVRALAEDVANGTAPAVCAARFHHSLACTALDICLRIRDNTGLEVVALSGGCFANAILTERLIADLAREGFETLLNERAPAADGGISLGQAAVAAWRLTCV